MSIPEPSLGKIVIQFDQESYRVSPGLTILVALEEVGLRFVRGVGCRGGVCGACTVFYRLAGKYELHAALMCQDLVQEGMEILPLPYFPQKKVDHLLELPEGDDTHDRLMTFYPEVNRCIMCGECSRICPVGIDVLAYVGMIKRGDLHGAARESFLCIQCQACVLRCPAQISQPNAALATRRLHGVHQVPRAEHLTKALERYPEEHLERAFRRLRRMNGEMVQALYQRREREPDEAPPGTWLPEDRSLL